MSIEKIPPQNIEAERSVLGAMLMDKDAIINVAPLLQPIYFYDNRHAEIYKAITTLFEGGQPIDIVTLSDQLKKGKKLKKVGGRAYLTDLVASVPTSAHAEEYAKIVRDTYIRRSLISYSGKINELSFNEEKGIEEVVDQAEKMLFDVAQNGIDADFVHIKDLLTEAYERAEKRDKDNPYQGIPSGFRDLDKLLGGFQKSDLIILAARPSVGKTAMALNFILHAGLIEKKKVLFFSLEMSNAQIVDRLLGMQSKVPFWEIRNNRLSDEKMSRFVDAMGRLADADIFIHDKPGQSITEIRTKARRAALEQGVDIIIVDYLQLIHGHYRDNRVLEVTEISQGLKNIARELDVPVIALSQLSRAIEQRQGRRPQLSDLRESGSIEQDADVVMFIDREETYNPDTERKGLADLIVAKHRNGPTGDVILQYFKQIASFRDWTPREENQ